MSRAKLSMADHELDVGRVMALLESDEHIDAREYVDLIRRVGRVDPQILLNLGAWTYSFGLTQVFREDDPEGLVEVAFVGSTILDASGQHDQAIARIEQAEVLAAGNLVAEITLRSTRTFMYVTSGRVEGALKLLKQLESHDSIATNLHASVEVAAARCALLKFSVFDEALYLARAAREQGNDPIASFLMSQTTPPLAAAGRLGDAEALGRELLDYASVTGHRARQIDSQTALCAISARRRWDVSALDLVSEAEELLDNHALWKALLSAHYQQVSRGDGAAASKSLESLVHHHDWLNGAYHNAFAGIDAFGSALLRSAEVALDLPDLPTIFSLPNILASAEAVAMGGTLSAAADWLAWLEDKLPPEVVTSLEWPACRRRIEALLWLRMGDRDEACTGLERSIAVCEERGDSIEAEIGRAQLATLSGDEGQAELAASRLREVGIDSALFADAVLRIVDKAGAAGALLTIREARVIGRLANGLSHREIEAELGLPRRGAARAITTGYAKLGVTGRAQAAQVARDRLIA